MDNGKRYYVIDRSGRKFAGTILECDLLQNWRSVVDTETVRHSDDPETGTVQEWVKYAQIGDELTDTDRHVRIIRTR